MDYSKSILKYDLEKELRPEIVGVVTWPGLSFKPWVVIGGKVGPGLHQQSRDSQLFISQLTS